MAYSSRGDDNDSPRCGLIYHIINSLIAVGNREEVRLHLADHFPVMKKGSGILRSPCITYSSSSKLLP